MVQKLSFSLYPFSLLHFIKVKTNYILVVGTGLGPVFLSCLWLWSSSDMGISLGPGLSKGVGLTDVSNKSFIIL